jgi:hypothetical protein
MINNNNSYPSDFKHIEKEWETETHRHWIENFKDEDTGEIIPIERKEILNNCNQ